MKPYNDFTFVIQGPLHKNCIHGIMHNYHKYTDNIVVSHWDTDALDMETFLTTSGKNVILVRNKFHTNYNVYNQQNVYYQTFSTLMGVRKVNTKFVLKLRTDQWFGNLIPILEKIRQYPEKFICGNLHFRPDNIYQYHPSDKLYGGSTNLIRNTLEVVYHRIKNNVPAMMAGAFMYTDDRNIVSEERLLEDMGVYNHNDERRVTTVDRNGKPLLGTIKVFSMNYIGLIPEVILGTSFLMAKGIYPDPKKSVKYMKENFDIVRVEDMVPYLNKNGSSKIEHVGIEIDYIEGVG